MTEGPVSLPPAETPGPERRINVWVGEHDEGLQGPLHVGVVYPLNFMVGEPVVGSLVAGPEGVVPQSDVPPEGLETDWVVLSSDVEFFPPTADAPVTVSKITTSTVWTAAFRLQIPFKGNSAIAQVLAKPRRTGVARLQILLYARSELYRQLAVELPIQKESDEKSHVPARAPAATATVKRDTIRSPLAHLLLDTTHEWATPPGSLSISVVENLAVVKGDSYSRDDTGQPRSAKEDTRLPWVGVAARVSGPIANVIATAERFRSRWEGYLNDIDPGDLLHRLGDPVRQYNWDFLQYTADARHEQAWASVASSAELRDLAYDGHALYEAFFPARSRLREILDGLPAGHRIDIDWPPQDGYVPHVPWGLMYTSDVPLAGQPIDPMAFVGLRFRVGYTSHDVPEGAGKALGRLDQTHAAHLLYWGDDPSDVTGMEARWQRGLWGAWANQVVVPTGIGDALVELQQLIAEPVPPPMSILYLFCQWGGQANDPLLRFGPPARPYDLRRTDLGGKGLVGQPLVFVNACTSAASDPYMANLLEETFFNRGCRAYIGTETRVPIPLASRFASAFFHFFYTQVDDGPIPAGEALSQARLFLWTNYRNVGGLLYTYVNTYELFMADDHKVRSLRV